jgi:2',3'-cyclic-nucleotide 2'-phosphodiesterase (5'-nucleotidase family)
MNAAGMDYVGFGNHEFDISESELQSRIDESSFEWISSNSFHRSGNESIPFIKHSNGGTKPLPAYLIRTFRDADGTSVKIGFIGINIPFNRAAYVTYTEPLSAAVNMYNTIKDSCDAVVAITHQVEQDDILLAKKLPGLALIMGGHEHDMRYDKVGDVIIAKAHSNARSAYIFNLEIDKRTGKKSVKASLKTLDQSVPLDAATDAVVKKWNDIAEKNYSSVGFDAKKIVIKKGEPLDAREAVIRKSTTNFTKIIVNAMEQASDGAQVAIVNSGSIRLDDVLQPPVSQYDILRTLPFGGSIIEI